MKKVNLLFLAILSIVFFTIESCGPVVFSSSLGTPPPHWFYPNRVETVRYVYFPNHQIYYDFSFKKYIYLDNNAWIRVNVLPARFKGHDLRRSKQLRIKDYYGDNIRKYHNETTVKRVKTNNRRYY